MRRRFRFSLRTLFLLTLVAALAMVTASRREPWREWMRVPVIQEDEGWADFKFSPDSSKLLVWSQNFMQIWDVESKTLVRTYSPPVVLLDCDWVGEWGISFASLDGRLRVWNMTASALSEYPKRANPNMYQQIEASAKGTRVMLFPGKRNGAELWDLRTGRLRGEYPEGRFAGFSLDGRHFLIRKGTDTLEVHDSEDGKRIAEFARPQRVLLEEGWEWGSGFIRTAEVEFVDGGVQILATGEEEKVVEQKFWKVRLQFRDGKLVEVGRDFNVGIMKSEPAYEEMAKFSRRGTAPDGRKVHGTTVTVGEEHYYYLPWPAELTSSASYRSDFAPNSSYIACVQNGAAKNRIYLWQNHRPEQWWGILWMPECWVTIACALGMLFSLYHDGKTVSAAKNASISKASNESSAAPVEKSTAKAI